MIWSGAPAQQAIAAAATAGSGGVAVVINSIMACDILATPIANTTSYVEFFTSQRRDDLGQLEVGVRQQRDIPSSTEIGALVRLGSVNHIEDTASATSLVSDIDVPTEGNTLVVMG